MHKLEKYIIARQHVEVLQHKIMSMPVKEFIYTFWLALIVVQMYSGQKNKSFTCIRYTCKHNKQSTDKTHLSLILPFPFNCAIVCSFKFYQQDAVLYNILYWCQSSYSAGNLGSSLGVLQLVCEADHSHLSSGEVKNGWNYTFTPPYAFMVCTETT
jgi:hypothetical protein